MCGSSPSFVRCIVPGNWREPVIDDSNVRCCTSLTWSLNGDSLCFSSTVLYTSFIYSNPEVTDLTRHLRAASCGHCIQTSSAEKWQYSTITCFSKTKMYISNVYSIKWSQITQTNHLQLHQQCLFFFLAYGYITHSTYPSTIHILLTIRPVKKEI